MNRFERFEFLFDSSGCIIVFLICFVAISIYTMLTLPVPREYVYFSKLLTYGICFMFLVATQFLSAGLGYKLIAWNISSKQFGENVIRPANNGLFLAFVRSGFFRIILPFGVKHFVSSVSIFTSFICSMYYCAICERSRRYLRFGIVIINIVLITYSMMYRINVLSRLGLNDYRNMYLVSFAMVIVNAFIIYDSIRLIKRSAIV